MAISVFDLFSVGIGPSSSHTVGPMRAASRFVAGLHRDGLLDQVVRVKAELFGSLAATGHGHGSPKAVLLGLEGHDPETVEPSSVEHRMDEVRSGGALLLAGAHEVRFDPDKDLLMHRRKSLPLHPNGMRFSAYGETGLHGGTGRHGETGRHGGTGRHGETGALREAVFYSVGGGFVVDEDATGADRIKPDETPLRHPFGTGAQLLEQCSESGARISDVMLANELSWRSEEQVRAGLLHIWSVMRECVDNGSRNDGVLPGGLKVRRRAATLRASLTEQDDPMEWLTLFALAVNEENAAGGRVVTAPTNGAAGIVPAVLHYYARFVPDADEDGIVRFLLAAGAIGVLFKENASISGAEVGCQGEVGSACSMAAAGLAEVLGATPGQVENAAEIAVEHNLGLTCDPVGGLVQIPCIERNAVASVKAVTAARMALRGNGSHVVSLDKAIRTMRDTGRDMKVKYKETARGGLAVNVIEC